MKILENQGYKVKSSILYQDNQSAIRLEKNAQRSSSRRTRHLDIKYFWVRDRLRTGGVEVIYCPKESMVADYFTKPLQGAIFRKLRDIVIGRVPISELKIQNLDADAQRSVLETSWRLVLFLGYRQHKEEVRIKRDDVLYILVYFSASHECELREQESK